MKRYVLHNRYQDSGWEPLGKDYEYDSVDEAVQRAARCASESIYYGMVRVFDKINNEIVVTFPAG